jgi:hypothetical protein
MKKGKKTIIITSVVAAVLLLATLAAWFKYQYDQAMKYCYKVSKFKVVSFNKDRLLCTMTVLVKNVSSLGATVVGYSFGVSLNGKFLGTAKDDAPFRVKPNAVSELPVTLDVNPKKGFSPEEVITLSAYALTNKEKLVFSFKGGVRVKVLGISFTAPYSATYSLKELLEDDPDEQSCTF